MDDLEYEKNLRKRIYQLMRELPVDKATTYGDLAAFAGSPRAARIVGGIAHQGPEELPWHRLVNAEGGLAIGFPGGQEAQRQLLEQDGIECDANYRIKDFGERRWRPQEYDPNLRLL
jgi:methylated-DNA-protein-cysteine methyltransferase-like protein